MNTWRVYSCIILLVKWIMLIFSVAFFSSLYYYCIFDVFVLFCSILFLLLHTPCGICVYSGRMKLEVHLQLSLRLPVTHKPIKKCSTSHNNTAHTKNGMKGSRTSGRESPSRERLSERAGETGRERESEGVASLKFSIGCTKINISTRKRWIYLLYVKRQETK